MVFAVYIRLDVSTILDNYHIESQVDNVSYRVSERYSTAITDIGTQSENETDCETAPPEEQAPEEQATGRPEDNEPPRNKPQSR